MRELVTAERIREFMRRLGQSAVSNTRIYLVGGSTAVLSGWRASTIDIDLKIVPDRDELFRALPRLKEELKLNVELASPDLFIPSIPGWEERSPFIVREGNIDWHHYDPYSQVLAKIERGHERDLTDVREMIRRGWVESGRLRECYESIVPDLIRYPAIDPESFAQKVDEALAGGS